MPTLQARSFGAGHTCRAPLPGPQGLGSCSHTQVCFLSGGGPHCGDKSGWNGGREGQESPHPLLPWGQGLTPLEGQRQEVGTPGAGFFNWFYFNFYYIFSFSIKEPLPTLSLVWLLAVPLPLEQSAGAGCPTL